MRDIDGLVKRLLAGPWERHTDTGRVTDDAPKEAAAAIRELQAERDRLRDALGGVILATDNSGLEFATVGMRVAERCEDIARAALATPPKSGT